MASRTLAAFLCLLGLIAPVRAKGAVSPATRTWVAAVVDRVDRKISLLAKPAGTRKKQLIEFCISVAGDGTVLNVSFGQAAIPEPAEKRLRAAIAAAAPFSPPPQELLAQDGSTELSFLLEVPTLLQ